MTHQGDGAGDNAVGDLERIRDPPVPGGVGAEVTLVMHLECVGGCDRLCSPVAERLRTSHKQKNQH